MPDTLRDRLQDAVGAEYAVGRELGGGGMARAFLADDRPAGRRVVIKVLPPPLGAGLSVERFWEALGRLATLRHPNLLPVLAAGDVGGAPWYVIPHAEGEPLRARLAGGPIPLGTAARLLADLARGLAYAHGRGVVHRDVKPDNVLLAPGGALLTDVGIAEALAEALAAAKGPAAGDGAAAAAPSFGTPGYMAPEQAMGDAADHRADLYAWGLVAYEALAGRHPFADRTTARGLMVAHIAHEPDPLGTLAPGVPAALAALVTECLAKAPASRPPSAQAVLDRLEAIELPAAAPQAAPQAAPPQAPPPARPDSPPARRRGTLALVALVLLATLAVAAAVAAAFRQAP